MTRAKTTTTARRKAPTRKPKGIKVRLLGKRSTLLGRVYARFEASDGQRTDVLIRDGWGQPWLLSPAEAQESATWRLTASPGSIRLLDQSPAGWHIYERTDGAQHAIPTRGRRGTTLTADQTNELAKRAMEGE